ncbi:MAG: immune inhibitor A [Anaerolineae bacterium]|nr:immune inhibitor A [Anaerolineae bacterium]
MLFSATIRRWWPVLAAGVVLLTALVLIMPAIHAQPAHGAPLIQAITPTPAPALLGGETLSLIHNTLIPPRDRNDLARRLLGVTDIPAPPTTAPPELAVGDVISFWADNLDEDYSFQVDAELVYKTEHIYMFVEQGEWVDRDAIRHSADTFETVIRPKVHAVFGTEWFPGIDGDPHLYILHARRLGYWVAAYYGSSSQYPVEAVSTSNEHEMFFVNLDTMLDDIGTPYYESILAHEFQHMVHWSVDKNETTWLNEGLSELAPLITGYGASEFAPDFLQMPDIQLNNWPEDDNRGLHYGASFLFAAYFYERYGEAATSALVRDPANGLDSVANTLAAINAIDPRTGQPVTLADLFGDWLVTNLLMDPSAGDGRFTYSFAELAGLPKADTAFLITPTVSTTDFAPQWGPRYLHIPGGAEPQRVRFTLDGAETVRIVPAQPHSGRYMWWANRADESDTRLTRAFDLSGVNQATLEFWTWYFIEDLWDYGYVLVSTDGGATWTPLESANTTTDDPHDNAYGPGYTGQSGGWIQESVDLTPYAGQKILVRFEYITDDAVTQPGMLIDDVGVPEIGYFEDFERGDGGWASQGWLRMDNMLPQPFLVQLVQVPLVDLDSAETWPVTRLLGPDDTPNGSWEFTVGGSAGDAVIVVSGLAPVTTEAAQFSYTLEPAQD